MEIIDQKKTLKAYIKMEKHIKLGDIETQKQTFHQHKVAISIKNYLKNKWNLGKSWK